MVSCFACAEQLEKTEWIHSMAETRETVLSVPDISCEHCVKTINGALGALPGVGSIQTDIPSKSVRLRYDEGQVTMAQIETTLDDAGYTIAK